MRYKEAFEGEWKGNGCVLGEVAENGIACTRIRHLPYGGVLYESTRIMNQECKFGSDDGWLLGFYWFVISSVGSCRKRMFDIL